MGPHHPVAPHQSAHEPVGLSQHMGPHQPADLRQSTVPSLPTVPQRPLHAYQQNVPHTNAYPHPQLRSYQHVIHNPPVSRSANPTHNENGQLSLSHIWNRIANFFQHSSQQLGSYQYPSHPAGPSQQVYDHVGSNQSSRQPTNSNSPWNHPNPLNHGKVSRYVEIFIPSSEHP
ncbi:hypothetical protein BU23DRAFT_87325 [Bimuria novae-zelandiae CBS 107.79]|uniref:Uncharacterized protein n=1 Tax=Bimuria novae-zelandiae CBS 107.79 TaxID=1447943 RepID=A0A6A5VD87_9PLEO|nr:hypothetical protein BU23DRAFT_87325 [Bimuria novae-zelandiae CBS 107.79]